eukprot:Plantae.Rhodophyta-Purpureofilum_apyrenoidigerum.ctg2303.p1 GENE.Plantae.Rhodophyta-Purpureofilum_apyrenoidigerum.ctg2303~~Plantae.Rhodophyta-Purpureofilum_apyrenoidigerum.ctg2303.p1  ORF type:complete len:414 (-),score=54.20 Plantae.Rhodophyta-Purpureofilum_apyrenoidigerum.ctg2303:489-1730(-)
MEVLHSMKPDERAWLTFEDESRTSLSITDLNRAATCSVVKRDIHTNEIVTNMHKLFVPIKETETATLGFAPFTADVITSMFDLGDVVDERYVVDYSRHMPRCVSTVLFSSGMIVMVAHLFEASGDHVDVIAAFPKNNQKQITFCQMAKQQTDCEFCNARQELCTCTEDMRRQGGKNFALLAKGSAKKWQNGVIDFLSELLRHQTVGFYVHYGMTPQGLKKTSAVPVRSEIELSITPDRWSTLKTLYLQREAMKFLPPSLSSDVPTLSGVSGLSDPCLSGSSSGCVSGIGSASGVEIKEPDGNTCNCGASFARRCDLRRHIRVVHEGQKRHQCDICKRSFAQQSHVREHIASIHDKRKDHICDDCGAAFCVRRKLVRHVREVHNKERKEPCPKCDKAYVHRVDLKRHLVSIHGM